MGKGKVISIDRSPGGAGAVRATLVLGLAAAMAMAGCADLIGDSGGSSSKKPTVTDETRSLQVLDYGDPSRSANTNFGPA